jgi:D-alanyl-D-alanine carboxypeptidase
VIAAAVAAGSTSAAAESRYAAIVVDAKTGKALHEAYADAPRYPASLTKMMTLYMAFEALKTGRVSKATKVPFSKYAAAKPPTKIGVPAGGSITLETAIYTLVTKSANDVAAAVGEMLGGSEAEFARMMTAKARQLGMTSTTFRNASGLPDSGQKTTARDMARLGIALREHFPDYYGYFSTRSYQYGKTRLGNHNKLLGRVKGVDGIKTGYIRASGFNLVSSVKTDNRSIVAVVMGGRTGASRDAHMRELIQKHLPRASTGGSGGLIAAAAPAALPKQNVPAPSFRPELEPETDIATAAVVTAFAEPTPASKMEVLADGEQSVEAEGSVDPVSTGSTPPDGWVIQVASMPSESEALNFLAETSRKAPTVLADAAAFTEVFDKAGTIYYRARFGGFPSKSAAWNACGALKKQKVACYAVQQ